MGSARTIRTVRGKVHMPVSAAGAPCPIRNHAEGHEMPRLPFTPDDESKRH
jgi:hypothetical protein